MPGILTRNIVLTAASAALLAGCISPAPPPPSPPPPPPPPPMAPPAPEAMIQVTGARLALADRVSVSPRIDPQIVDRERYEDVEPNPVTAVAEEPVSTFSIDVDTASYAVARSYLDDGVLPPRDAIRVEEVVNYFDYDYPLPDSANEPFSINVEVTPSPWNDAAQLIHIGVQGYDIIPEERPRANLVFLIDVSGSMNTPDKLGLARFGLTQLVQTLQPEDTVSIVVYAGAAGAVLEPTPASESEKIIGALDRLRAGGSTAGGEGLRLAYDLAERNFDPEAVNRVMMVTDGDFNVGITQDERLEDFVARKRESGIYLSVMGFGRGNYNDQLMQTIAQAGNGVAAYIDSEREARRLMVEEASSTLFPIANDVKIQVEFNPARVSEYRLIGYEARLLDRADFNNDRVDAGEIGSGHSVTAIYEIVEPGSEGALLEPLRYGSDPAPEGDRDGELGFFRLRYKAPGEEESRLIERGITQADVVDTLEEADTETRFAIHVAGYAQLLRGDPYLDASYDWAAIRAGAASALGEDRHGYRREFLDLVDRASYAAEQAALKPAREE